MEDALFFIDGMYSFIIEYRAFSKKDTSVASDFFVCQFVARQSVIENSVNDKAKIQDGSCDDENRSCHGNILWSGFLVEKDILQKYKYSDNAEEEVRQ